MKKLHLVLLFAANVFVINVFAQAGTPPAPVLAPSNEFNNRIIELEKGELLVVGDGQLQKSISDGEKLPATTGLGVLWNQIFKDNRVTHENYLDQFQLEVILNVASTVEKIEAFKLLDNPTETTRQFGSFLLVPANSGQSGFVNFRLWAKGKNFSDTGNKYKIQHGYDIGFVASNREFSLGHISSNTDTNNVTTFDTAYISKNVTALKFTGGFFLDFMPREVRITRGYSVIGGVNLSIRALLGDLGTNADDLTRKQYYNSEKFIFGGIEPFIELQIKNIRIFAKLPIHFSEESNRVDGLTGAQFYTGIRFTGGFPVQLK